MAIYHNILTQSWLSQTLPAFVITTKGLGKKWLWWMLSTTLQTIPIIIPPHNEVVGGGGIILVSLHPSVRLSIHLSVRQSVHPASSVRSVAPEGLVGQFHIYTSYQASSEGVSCLKFIVKFDNFNFGHFFLNLSLYFDLGSDVNH